MIAKKLGVPAAEVARIRLAATLHDVGKLVVPPAVLNKPGRLTEVELGVVERHAPVGADMVSPIGDDELTRIVAGHHERLDGTGYPSRLSGNEIPLGARIIAVADTFDALTSTRIYKPAKRHRDVFRILGEEMGTQLDPVAVQAFSRCYSGFRGIAAWSIVSGAPQRRAVAARRPGAGRGRGAVRQDAGRAYGSRCARGPRVRLVANRPPRHRRRPGRRAGDRGLWRICARRPVARWEGRRAPLSRSRAGWKRIGRWPGRRCSGRRG